MKFRIVTNKHGFYSIECMIGWIPFWYELPNQYETVDDAESEIQETILYIKKSDNFKKKVVKVIK